jgi:hypothetical protein
MTPSSGCCIFCHKELATENERLIHIMDKHPWIVDAFILWVVRRSSPLRYQAAYANEFVWRGPDSDAAD